MNRRLTALLALVLALGLGTLSLAAETTLSLSVAAGKFDRRNTPVKVLVQVPESLGSATVAALQIDGVTRIGQLSAPSLFAKTEPASPGKVVRELTFVVPQLKAGESLKLTATVVDSKPTSETFRWTDTKDEFAELSYGQRPVLCYMYAPLDEAKRELTYKVFHHVFDPTGKQILTKGPGGQYTHHRGLFYGFNKVKYQNTEVDIWHCKGDTHQAHESFLATEAGPVLGRQRLAISWNGVGKKPFAKEQRELAVYNVPGGQMIEFSSRLKSVAGPLSFSGDPQHAGFHFRASNEVSEKTAKQTFYVRPDGKGDLGKTRNWPGDKQHVNLPWNAMSFVVGGERFTCCYLDRPQNPKEARFSERDYGRFGSYFEYQLPEDGTLDVSYRIWLQSGEMTGDLVQALSNDFVEPPTVSVGG